MDTSPIDSRVLFWSCNDESNLVAAVIKQTLDAWQAASRSHHQRLVVDHPGDVLQLGLSVWSVFQQSQLSPICAAIDIQRRNNPALFQLVYLQFEFVEYRSWLIEAGATFVATEMGQLQSTLASVVDRLPMSNYGHHPITSGLISRLPWGS